MGYENDKVGYRLWDPIKKKIVRVVIFFEDQKIDDIHKVVKRISQKEHPNNIDPIPHQNSERDDALEEVGETQN